MAHYLSSAEVVEKTGLPRRTLARVSPSIPGAVRFDGLHWRYKDSLALQEWIEGKKRKRAIQVARRRNTDRDVLRQSWCRNSGITFDSLASDTTRSIRQILSELPISKIRRLGFDDRQEIERSLEQLMKNVDELIPVWKELKNPFSTE
jgi:hypothetical protein